MFLKKYVNNTYYNLILDNYNIDYLKNLDERQFIEIYNLLKKRGFYYICDIILNYLEIFSYDINYVDRYLDELKNKLGDKYIYIIGNDMRYLENI